MMYLIPLVLADVDFCVRLQDYAWLRHKLQKGEIGLADSMHYRSLYMAGPLVERVAVLQEVEHDSVLFALSSPFLFHSLSLAHSLRNGAISMRLRSITLIIT